MPVFVSAPSRLHFGLLRFEQPTGPSFGGLGMMIDRPRLEVAVSAADQWSVDGFAAARAREAAERALASTPAAHKPSALALRVTADASLHHGLGGGTQLALAIAAGVRALVGLPPGDAATLAAAVGRGQRSAVGSYGFVHGGLIWELGRQPNEPLSALGARIDDAARLAVRTGGLAGRLRSERSTRTRRLSSASPDAGRDDRATAGAGGRRNPPRRPPRRPRCLRRRRVPVWPPLGRAVRRRAGRRLRVASDRPARGGDSRPGRARHGTIVVGADSVCPRREPGRGRRADAGTERAPRDRRLHHRRSPARQPRRAFQHQARPEGNRFSTGPPNRRPRKAKECC